jgi:hypothetical protein
LILKALIHELKRLRTKNKGSIKKRRDNPQPCSRINNYAPQKEQ